MGVNFLAGNNAATQEAAMAGSQALEAELSRLDQQSGPDKSTKTSKKEILRQIKEGKTAKIDVELLKGLVKNVAVSGFNFSAKKFSGKVKDEYDLMLQQGKEDLADQVKLSDSQYFVRKSKSLNNQQRGQGQGFLEDLPPAVKEMIAEYAEAYSSFVADGGKELKKKLENLEVKLKQSGVSLKDLKSLQTGVKNSMRSEIMRQVKDAYVKRMFSPEKSFEHVINESTLDGTLDYATLNHKLGGEDFGGYQNGLQGSMDEMMETVQGEVKDFVREELTNKVVKDADLPAEEMEKNIQDLVKLGVKVGFDFEQFNHEIKDKLYDLGATPLPPGMTDNNSFLDQRRKQEMAELNVKDEDEKNLFIVQMIKIYRQRSMGNGWTKIRTAFRMRKLKNGLIKLGLNFEDFKKLERKGKIEALKRFKEALDRLLEERASLYQYSGADYALLKDKIKAIRSNVERLSVQLGETFTEEYFAQMVDTANRKIFDQALQEYQALEGFIKMHKKSLRAEDKLRKIGKTLEKLSKESNIPLKLEAVSVPRAQELV